MNRLRVGFVSGVRHADSYAGILAADPRVELVGMGEEPGVAGWITDDGRAVAERHGIAWREGLDWIEPGSVDLALICSEPVRHARLAVQALEQGVHVLVDKPVATSLADADRVVAAAAKGPGRCAVVNRTHAPALRRLRGWVDEGLLGLPLHLDAEFLASGAHFASSVERPELVVDPALSGGGELLNFLGYCVDAIRHVTGLGVDSVFSMTGSLFSETHRAHDVEDVGVVSLGLDRGVTATVTVGRVPFAPGLGATSSSLRVLGSHGDAVADDDRPALERFGDDGLRAESFDGGATALRGYLNHVVSRTLADRPFDYDATDARATLAVIDAAMRSVSSGRAEPPRP